jgi:polyisoprenoid-binding protein YceI
MKEGVALSAIGTAQILNKHIMRYVYALFLVSVFQTSCGQNQANQSQDKFSREHNGLSQSQIKKLATSKVPMGQVRHVKQARNGDILIATTWSGVFRYDGKSFTNITSSKIGSHRFWDVLEDRRGNLWFASLDSGVYYYNGESFQHFTTREGLANNAVMCIYEDRAGIIWFGGGGLSRYDGNSSFKSATKIHQSVFSNYFLNNIMNKKLLIHCLILINAPIFFGCHGHVKAKYKSNESASSISLHVGDERYIKIDTKESVVAWTSSSIHGRNTGYVYISNGELMIEKGQLVGGTVEVDMYTIEDKNHQKDNGLIDHLKSPDFFDIEKFPFSTIAITRVDSTNNENKTVTGDLTIKGTTHPITFPVKMVMKDGMVEAGATLVIDRTLWDIRYRSGKFFDNLKNEVIPDSIEFNIKIVAKKS